MSPVPELSSPPRLYRSALPPLDDLLDGLYVVALPLRTRFRGITTREVALLEGPAGWGEFAPFLEYGPEEASRWLLAGLHQAYDPVPAARRSTVRLNGTVPAIAPDAVPELLDRYPGVDTVKIKVAEAGESLRTDIDRVAAVAAARPEVRIRTDANRAYSEHPELPGAPGSAERLRAVADHLLALAEAAGGVERLDYHEQPVATVAELATVTRHLRSSGEGGGPANGGCGVSIAADESIRRAEDPLAVARSHAADVAVLKAPPLGGSHALVALAETLAEYGLRTVVASALDSAVGLGDGLAAAAALPVDEACGLGTGRLFAADLAARTLKDGRLAVGAVIPATDALERYAVSPETRQRWQERLRACYAVLAEEAYPEPDPGA